MRVNVTLGLPFVRTSPDHGTALDIAGTGRADPTSLIAALRWPPTWPRRPALAAALHDERSSPACRRCARSSPPRSRRQEIARPAFPARPQPDRRASPAPPAPLDRRHGDRGRPRPRRADARAAARRRRARRSRSSATRAAIAALARDRGALSAAGSRSSRPTR